MAVEYAATTLPHAQHSLINRPWLNSLLHAIAYSLANTQSLSASLAPHTLSSATTSNHLCRALLRFSRYFASYLLRRPVLRVGNWGNHFAWSLHSSSSVVRNLTNDEKRLCAMIGVPCFVMMRSSKTTQPRACEPTSDQPRIRISRAKTSEVERRIEDGD